MIEGIINTLNLTLETTGRIDKRYCLTEQRTSTGDNSTTVPYAIEPNGQLNAVDYGNPSLSWWRVTSPFSIEEVTTTSAVNKKQATYSLRLVVMYRRKESTADNGFTPAWLAEDIGSVLTQSNGDLKTVLKAADVRVSVTSTDIDTTRVWNEEFKDLEFKDPKYVTCLIAFELSVTVIARPDCWETECNYDTDILHVFDFCKTGTFDRLTDEQKACLTTALCGDCADVTIQVDGNTIDTTPAGSTYSFRSKDTAGTTIGTIANPSVIADNTINFNGADVDTVKAEESYAFLVKLDGINSGTYNAGTNTVSVVSAVCADATTQVNAVNVGTVASGGTFDQQIHDSLGADVGTAANPSVIADTTIRNNATPTWTDTVEAEGTLTLAQAKALDSDGATTLLADYIPAADGFMFTCTPSALIPSLSVTVDDTTPSFGDTILVTATPTNFTPTGYRFYAQGTSDAMFIGTSATNTINWKVVAPNGAVSIYAEAVDGTGATAYTDTPQAITVSGALLNRFPTATMGFSLEQRCYRFFSSLLIIRRSSDNATSNFGFVNGSLDTASILTFCGAGDGFVVTWYGQSSNRNIAYQQTAASQPKIVSSGAMVTASNGKPAMDFDGVNDFMNILNTGSFVTGFFSYQNDAIATRLVQEIVACGTTFTAQVYAAGTATTGAGGGSGATAIASTVKDTNRHYMSIMTASNDGIYIDGTDITLGVLGTFTALVLIGNRGGQNFFMDGKIQDIIGYPDDQFANRAAIETYLT